jgi:hypothetical protein
MLEPLITPSPSSRLSTLKYYLEKVTDPKAKKAIAKKLKMVLSMHSEFDSDPIDYYRYYGVQAIRLILIKEVNKMIMDHIGRYTYLIPWARELWELKVACEQLLGTTEQMLRSLIAHDNPSGLYSGGPLPESKPTTSADAEGSNEGSTVQPQSQEAL